MIVTVQIETNTEAGLKLITELRRYPDIVRFVEPDEISEPIPEGYVPVKDGFEGIHPSVTIFGKMYRFIALQETNEL